MKTSFAVLLHGTIDDILDALEDEDLSLQELQAAVTNLAKKIKRLSEGGDL